MRENGLIAVLLFFFVLNTLIITLYSLYYKNNQFGDYYVDLFRIQTSFTKA